MAVKTCQKKRKRFKPWCTCDRKVDDLLRKDGFAITTEIRVNFSTGKLSVSQPSIRIKKLDTRNRKRVPVVLCRFCPFCGTKYAEPEDK